MKHLFSFIVLSFLMMASIPAFAQEAEDFRIGREAAKIETTKSPWSSYIEISRGPVQKVAAITFVGYKRFVASQDSRQCAYHRTCSEYCLNSMKDHGIFAGFVMGLERFERCSAFDAQFYLRSPISGRRVDPLNP